MCEGLWDEDNHKCPLRYLDGIFRSGAHFMTTETANEGQALLDAT